MYLAIYSKDTLELLDTIRTYNYVQYTDEYSGIGSFEIVIPTDESSLPYLLFGNYIYFEEGVFGIIKQIKDQQNSDFEIKVTGYLSNHILEYRSILKTQRYYDTPPNIAIDILEDLFIYPSDSRRRIKTIKISTATEDLAKDVTEKVNYQNTGNTALECLQRLLETYNLGFKLDFKLKNDYSNSIDSMVFKIISPKNRTINNTDDNTPIVFSFDLDNISSIEYEEDGRSYCNVAIVASEGEGQDRYTLEVGDEESEGIDRIELYVDARDIQEDNSEESETSYSVDLNNGEWVEYGTYEGRTLYRSESNYHVANSISTCTVTIKGYKQFTVYVRSDSEIGYDYVQIGSLDAVNVGRKDARVYWSGQYQGFSYFPVTFNNIDGRTHTFEISYTKDESNNRNTDRGYFYIGIQQDVIDEMKQRGAERLSECQNFVSMDSSVIFEAMQYKYGVDFRLGDFVTVYSKKLKKYFDLQITSLTKTISNGVEHTDIYFGKDRLKITTEID